MLGRTYEKQICSIARALEIVGERWSVLILRNAMFVGVTRFTDFQRSLGIAPNILSNRLENFVKEGLMTTSKGKSEHLEYHLTPKGLDFKPVLLSLREWGDRWSAPEGPPVSVLHGGCGGHVSVRLQCKKCGQTPKPTEMVARPTKVYAVYQEKQQNRKRT